MPSDEKVEVNAYTFFYRVVTKCITFSTEVHLQAKKTGLMLFTIFYHYYYKAEI